jgi:hypothetical protein
MLVKAPPVVFVYTLLFPFIFNVVRESPSLLWLASIAQFKITDLRILAYRYIEKCYFVIGYQYPTRINVATLKEEGDSL